jgi:hypothetical protein
VSLAEPWIFGLSFLPPECSVIFVLGRTRFLPALRGNSPYIQPRLALFLAAEAPV